MANDKTLELSDPLLSDTTQVGAATLLHLPIYHILPYRTLVIADVEAVSPVT